MWTKEQLDAITMEGNLLVSAAAGAGKTAVMTERIARIIAEGTRVEELLVVTYTKPAAAEMKQRIEKRLSELCDEEADPEKKRLLISAVSSISRANISTIHSFCTNVLKRNYHLIGLDPAFRVGDESETALILNEALDETTEEFYLAAEKNRDEASAFIKDVFDNNDGLRDIITSIYRFVIARPEPEKFIEKAVSYYGENFDEAAEIAGNFILREAQKELFPFKAYCERVYNENREILTGKETGYLNILNSDMQDINDFLSVDSYEKMQWRLEGYKLPPLSVKGYTAPDDLKIYRNQLRETIKKLCNIFKTPLSVERKMANALLPVMEIIGRLVLDFMARFAEKKRQEAVIDYADMEQMTLKVLSFDDAAEEYRRKFRYVFIDEYQDTNLVQDSIIGRISRGDNLFMVGDVKQSIYRFRQAEPASFLEKYKKYDGSVGTRIDLNNNFRSCTSILNAANSLFSKLMLGDVGEIDYSDNAALRPGENKTAGKVELDLIELSPESYYNAVGIETDFRDEYDDDSLAELDNIEAEASFIAEKISEIMATQSVFDKEKGAMRKPVFSDFAVLMRKTRVPALKLINTLNERGIPCSAELGDGYFDAIEVQVFINLLRVIDNARQDIPLVSVLRSPMFGLTDAELVQIRTDAPGEAFIDRLIGASDRFAAEGEKAPSGCKKAAYFLQKLFEWRKKSGLVSIETLVGLLYDETRYYTYVGAMPGGAVRQANLDLLLEKARAFGAGGRRGVHAFVNLLDSVRDNTSIGAAQAASVDAVRVMSIHKSKGLEFPIVFVCGLTGEFSRANSRSAAVTDSELGIGLRVNRGFRIMENLTEFEPAAIKNPLFRRAIEAKDASRQSAEEMRVLYVAMTRAREQLYLVGAKKKLAQLIENAAAPLTEHGVMSAKNYLQWILGAYFPFGLNLANAAKGVTTPIGDDAMLTRYILSDSAEGSDVRIKKAAFESWKEEARSAEHGEIDEKLGFVYPFIEDTKISAKSAVTAVAEAEREYVPAIPAFIRNEEGHRLTAAERGTATHRLIQLLPKEATDREGVEDALAQLTEKGFFKEEEAAAVDVFAVSKLVSSKLYKRLLASDFVRREQEFSLMEANGALVQGIIDCFFKEGDGLILIDYKTTSTRDRSPEEVAESYTGQLVLYAEALERLTGMPVKEKWVYLLSVPGAYRLK